MAQPDLVILDEYLNLDYLVLGVFISFGYNIKTTQTVLKSIQSKNLKRMDMYDHAGHGN